MSSRLDPAPAATAEDMTPAGTAVARLRGAGGSRR
jgi:hypothetical protein